MYFFGKHEQEEFLDPNYYSTHENDKIVSSHTIDSLTILPISECIDSDLETIAHIHNNGFSLIPIPGTKRKDFDEHGMIRYIEDFYCFKTGNIYRHCIVDKVRNGPAKRRPRKHFSLNKNELELYIDNYYDRLPKSLNISKELLFFKLDHTVIPKLVNKWNPTATLINFFK